MMPCEHAKDATKENWGGQMAEEQEVRWGRQMTISSSLLFCPRPQLLCFGLRCDCHALFVLILFPFYFWLQKLSSWPELNSLSRASLSMLFLACIYHTSLSVCGLKPSQGEGRAFPEKEQHGRRSRSSFWGGVCFSASGTGAPQIPPAAPPP